MVVLYKIIDIKKKDECELFIGENINYHNLYTVSVYSASKGGILNYFSSQNSVFPAITDAIKWINANMFLVGYLEYIQHY